MMVLRRVPRACWACAAIAFVNVGLWAVVTPAFQVPDETVHVGYVEYLAETGKLPSDRLGTHAAVFAPEELKAIEGTRFEVESRPAWSRTRDREVDRVLAQPLGRISQFSAGYATPNPPLYYALDVIPYKLGSGLQFYDRLLLMRLLSALLAAFTVGCCFMFVRELLPTTPWAWRVGALAVAFQPLFAFIGGGVNNDNLVFAAGAALFAGLARAFARGLTPARGAWIGAAAVVGMLAKGSMFGLLPGAGLGVLGMLLRASPERRSTALRGLLTAAFVAAVPMAGWLVANDVVFHRTAATTSSGVSVTGSGITISGQLSYLWQFFLPRLPFMQRWFGGLPLWNVYFTAFVGRFGWYLYGFPDWVNQVALAIYAGALALVALALARARLALRSRWVELACYATMCAGLLVLIAIVGYRSLAGSHIPFEQARYLLPLLPLYAALIALAARGAGRRWGPALGGVLVVFAMGHSLFAMLLTISRYYA